MRKPAIFFVFVCALATLCLAQSASQKAPADPKLLTQPVLADGTMVKLRLSPTVNTATAHLGDSIQLDVIQEVRVSDVIVIPTTSSARAVVTSERIQASGGRDGKIDVNLRYVVLVDGQKVAIRPALQKKSGPDVVSSSTAQDITLTNGMEVTAFVDGNLPIDVPKMRLANQPMGQLKIASTPSSAEVAVDGNIVGTTPFSGNIPRGDHIVTVRAAGFETWIRTVRVAADPADLKIALGKKDGLESPAPAKVTTVSLGDVARAARAKKGDAPKASSEPIELIEESTKPAVPAPQNQ